MKRIQRRRTKGWRMPEGAIYVGRPTRWGNPYSVGSVVTIGPPWNPRQVAVRDRSHAVELYWRHLRPLDEPCHADVLMELANR